MEHFLIMLQISELQNHGVRMRFSVDNVKQTCLKRILYKSFKKFYSGKYILHTQWIRTKIYLHVVRKLLQAM